MNTAERDRESATSLNQPQQPRERNLADDFTFFDTIQLFFATFVCMYDGFSDCYLGYHYYNKGDLWYLSLTLSFVLLPSAITAAFNARHYYNGAKTNTASSQLPPFWFFLIWTLRILCTIAFILSYLPRYITKELDILTNLTVMNSDLIMLYMPIDISTS